MKSKTETITVSYPNMQIGEFHIVGQAPLVMNKFPNKVKDAILESQLNKVGARKPKQAKRDVQQEFQDAMHKTEDGHYGIPCGALRSAMIDACRLVQITMVRAKFSVFVLADDYDVDDSQPLFYVYGEPEIFEQAVRMKSGGAAIAVRARWKNWYAKPKIKFDADQLTLEMVSNLLVRAGDQIGILCGRYNSSDSHGMGWGLFDVEGN